MTDKSYIQDALDDAEKLVFIAENIHKNLTKIRNKMFVFGYLFTFSLLLLGGFFSIAVSEYFLQRLNFTIENALFTIFISIFLAGNCSIFHFLLEDARRAAFVEREALLHISRLIYDFYDFPSNRDELSPLRRAQIEVRLSRIEVPPTSARLRSREME